VNGKSATRHLPRSFRSWLRVAETTWAEVRADRSGIIASGVAFRVVIALFPAGALMTWLVTTLLGQSGSQILGDLVSGLLPKSADAMVEQASRGPLASDPGSTGGGAMFGMAAPYVGILIMLWSANGGMKALVDALNVVFDREERRGLLRFTLVTFGLTCGLLVFVLVAVALTLAIPALLSALPLNDVVSLALALARWPVLFAVIAMALAILYRVAPYGQPVDWPLASVGSIGASLLLVTSLALFSWYTTTLASFGLTYGSLSTVIAFMLWLWLSFFIVLVGAQLDAVLAQSTEDSGGSDKGPALRTGPVQQEEPRRAR
jgi:membrane protein